MQLAQILFSQGFGTRRLCAGLIERGEVTIAGQVAQDPQADVATDGLVFSVSGRAWPGGGRPQTNSCREGPGDLNTPPASNSRGR